jgi:hypothetical protein
MGAVTSRVKPKAKTTDGRLRAAPPKKTRKLGVKVGQVWQRSADKVFVRIESVDARKRTVEVSPRYSQVGRFSSIREAMPAGSLRRPKYTLWRDTTI